MADFDSEAHNESSCPYNVYDYSESGYVLRTALYNLSVPCPFNATRDTPDGIFQLDAPSTFIIQILRLSIAASAIVAILALYNSIDVLGKTVYSITSCSIHWVVFLLLIAIKSVALLVLLPILHKEDQNHTNTCSLDCVGFILTNLLQLLTTFVLYICLEHERRFRSADYASVASLFSSNIPAKTRRQLLFNWPRAFALFFTFVSLLVLIVLISVNLHKYPYKEESDVSNCSNIDSKVKMDAAFGPLVWVWLLSMLKVRMCVFSMVVCLLWIRRESFKLTVPAKVYLVLGLLFSLFEDIPNSVLTVIAFKTYNTQDNHVCIGDVFNLYDITQFLGVFSLVSFLLFVRSQYLRVEQESKLLVVGDMQRLLQVNGRRDVKSY